MINSDGGQTVRLAAAFEKAGEVPSSTQRLLLAPRVPLIRMRSPRPLPGRYSLDLPRCWRRQSEEGEGKT